MLKKTAMAWFLCAFSIFLPSIGYGNTPAVIGGPGWEQLSQEGLNQWIRSLRPAEKHCKSTIQIIEPKNHALFPPDFEAPVFLWQETDPHIAHWILTISKNHKPLVRLITRESWWEPDPDLWSQIQKTAPDQSLTLHIQGVGGWDNRQLMGAGQIDFSFAKDPVGAQILFLELPVPFAVAQTRPDLARWRVGKPGAVSPPETIMENQKVCANCHHFSLNGKVFGMDMDIDGDKGAFLLRPVKPEMGLQRSDFISWNDRPQPPPASFSFGLFARISPDGRYVTATVGETSVFIKMNDRAFSQLFFPATGRIGAYDRKTRRHFDLPGADHPDYVKTGPAWSPDGQTVAFSRARIDPDLLSAVQSGKLKKESPDADIHTLNQKYSIQYDIYTVPFNRGLGGSPQPLTGASQNGMSNYLPRYSPDGRWIVFTQSPTGLVLQPGSRLCIVPAGGGNARVLASNLAGMNSWHSWSPNSRWLVFSGKPGNTLTSLFLTHIDENGTASPAVTLVRFKTADRTAVLPEFVPEKTPIFRQMGLSFHVDATPTLSGR